MNFSKNLKRYRQEVGCTQAVMAQLLGITTRGYQYYESGKREPCLSDLVKIADYFSVSLDDLVGREVPAGSSDVH